MKKEDDIATENGKETTEDTYIYKNMSKNRNKYFIERTISFAIVPFVILTSLFALIEAKENIVISSELYEDEYLTETVFVKNWIVAYFENDEEYISNHTVDTVALFEFEESVVLDIRDVQVNKVDILDEELAFMGKFILGNTSYDFKITTSKDELLVTKQIEFEKINYEKVSLESIEILSKIESEYSEMESVSNADIDKINSFLKLLFDSINTDYDNASALYSEVENPQNYKYDLDSLVITNSGIDKKGNTSVLLKVRQVYVDQDTSVVIGGVDVIIEISFDLENKKIFSIKKY